MARRHSVWLSFLILLLGYSTHAADPKISYPTVPAWVRPVTWSPFTNSPDSAKTEGLRYLLYEEQERPKESGRFVHAAQLMESDNGVQDSGSLSFGFDPAFQELWLHKVVIHRRGKAIDRLDQSKVKLIQPESGLGDNVFTGEQNAVLFVEDLRVGDVLEYAYTVHGANPILDGHFSTRFTIESGSPVEREYFRVIWDGPVPLQQRSYQTDQPPVVKPFDGGTEYVWDFNHVAAVSYEDHQPASFEAYSYVEFSDFANWGEVVKWAVPLYETPATNLPTELAEKIDGWRNASADNAERVRLALQFVQDDLRYTGIELGPDSYLPANPVETFEKRFGDCKAKVALLRFLLRQMDIESYPALVSSSDHEGIASRLPTPFAFDHVILTIHLDGKTIWVDPTYSAQGGDLRNHHVPKYGKALIVRAGTEQLTDVPVNVSEKARLQKVTSTFEIKNYDQPATFTVHTEYYGAGADDMRDQFASTATDELAKQYLNYYTRLYPGIKSTRPLKFTDDRLANIIIAEESYQITNLWVQDDSDKSKVATFFADNLGSILTDPDTRQRKNPLALAYPLVRQQQIIVHLPDKEWDIPALETNLDNKYFSFKYHRLLKGSTMTYDYECRTKLSVVPAAEVPKYLALRERFENLLTDTLQKPDTETKGGVNWLMVMVAVFGVVFTTAGCIWYWWRTNAAYRQVPPPLNIDTRYQGLGGWLLLVGFSLCVAPILRLVMLGQNCTGYFSLSVWQVLTLPNGGNYHPLYAPVVVLELLGNLILLGMTVLALCLFFGRRRGFPNFFIAFAIGNAIFLLLDDIATALIFPDQHGFFGKQFSESIRALLYAVLWTAYMIKSRRVKATFTR